MSRLFLLGLGALLFAPACSTTRALAPLAKGQHGLTASFGGPFVDYGGAPIPLPLTSVGYRYGIDGKSDVHASVYATQAALFGVGGFDVGVSRELVDADGARPRVMLDTNHHLFFGDLEPGDPKGGVVYLPDVSGVLTWDLGASETPHRLYVGATTTFDVQNKGKPWLTPYIGTELRASKMVGVQLEAAIFGATVPTRFLNPVWYGIDEHGAIVARLGLNVYLPQKGTQAQAPADVPADEPPAEVPGAPTPDAPTPAEVP